MPSKSSVASSIRRAVTSASCVTTGVLIVSMSSSRANWLWWSWPTISFVGSVSETSSSIAIPEAGIGDRFRDAEERLDDHVDRAKTAHASILASDASMQAPPVVCHGLSSRFTPEPWHS
ncbi:MAG: hypothetical protein ACOC6J_10795, partial [Spirochaetota bacterium]